MGLAVACRYLLSTEHEILKPRVSRGVVQPVDGIM